VKNNLSARSCPALFCSLLFCSLLLVLGSGFFRFFSLLFIFGEYQVPRLDNIRVFLLFQLFFIPGVPELLECPNGEVTYKHVPQYQSARNNNVRRETYAGKAEHNMLYHQCGKKHTRNGSDVYC
jgi:hypothetical protein